ncbi:C6 zinc finger domain-containing protein [Colletotrichum incanum]|nr:C6 zinc finger domain-containing protein [Colletotrichum incanum]
MARKGSRKVRTGCIITCTARKVKYDETKPACNRGMSTGCKCSGYIPGYQEAISLQQPNHVFPGIGQASEGRALHYFGQVAGPVMSGAVEPYFWTHVVMQFHNFEPAVRHSVISIRSLYEQAQSTFELGIVMRHDNQHLTFRHYNAAIRELRAMNKGDKLPVILLVWILFICIETMRSNRMGALLHSRHVVKILKSICVKHKPPWVIEHLVPVFRRLSEFTLFFGDKESDVSDIKEVDEPIPPFFATILDAQMMLDMVFNRTAQLIRSLQNAKQASHTNHHQQGPPEVALITPERLAEQAAIHRLLDQWIRLFIESEGIMPKDTTTPKHLKSKSDNRTKILRCFLLTRFQCCRIWVSMAFDASETGYSRFSDNFQRALKHLLWSEAKVLEPLRRMALKHPYFIFEAGIVAILFFLAYPCPQLEMRLVFLRLMPVLGQPREALWEADILTAAAKKKIKLEHDIKLDNSGRPLYLTSYMDSSDDIRIIDLWKDSETEQNLCVDDQGMIILVRAIRVQIT